MQGQICRVALELFWFLNLMYTVMCLSWVPALLWLVLRQHPCTCIQVVSRIQLSKGPSWLWGKSKRSACYLQFRSLFPNLPKFTAQAKTLRTVGNLTIGIGSEFGVTWPRACLQPGKILFWLSLWSPKVTQGAATAGHWLSCEFSSPISQGYLMVSNKNGLQLLYRKELLGCCQKLGYIKIFKEAGDLSSQEWQKDSKEGWSLRRNSLHPFLLSSLCPKVRVPRRDLSCQCQVPWLFLPVRLLAFLFTHLRSLNGLPTWHSDKESACNARAAGDVGSAPGLGRSPGGGHNNPLQYSCLENPMDRGAWRAPVHGVTKSQSQLKWLSTQACTRSLNTTEE